MSKPKKPQSADAKEGMLYALEEMCVDIFAHSENDYEVTLSGNGVNSGEAAAVAWAILDILHGDGRAWQDKNATRIGARAQSLRREVGDE